MFGRPAPQTHTASYQRAEGEGGGGELPRERQPGYRVSFHTSRGCGSGTRAKVRRWGVGVAGEGAGAVGLGWAAWCEETRLSVGASAMHHTHAPGSVLLGSARPPVPAAQQSLEMPCFACFALLCLLPRRSFSSWWAIWPPAAWWCRCRRGTPLALAAPMCSPLATCPAWGSCRWCGWAPTAPASSLPGTSGAYVGGGLGCVAGYAGAPLSACWASLPLLTCYTHPRHCRPSPAQPPCPSTTSISTPALIPHMHVPTHSLYTTVATPHMHTPTLWTHPASHPPTHPTTLQSAGLWR